MVFPVVKWLGRSTGDLEITSSNKLAAPMGIPDSAKVTSIPKTSSSHAMSTLFGKQTNTCFGKTSITFTVLGITFHLADN